MRKMVAKLIAGAVLATVVAAGAFGADNSLGTWKLNMEKSTFSPTPTLKHLTSTREAAHGGIKVTNTGARADGTPVDSSYSAKYDFSEVPATGAPWDMIAIKKVNANTFTSATKKTNGKYRSTARTVISKDGRTMTSTVDGTNAEGKAFHNIMVYDKQ